MRNTEWDEYDSDSVQTIVFELDYDTQVEVVYDKMGNRWYEGRVIVGPTPYNWGGKTYQGYLTVGQIADWLMMDYNDVNVITAYI